VSLNVSYDDDDDGLWCGFTRRPYQHISEAVYGAKVK